MRSTETGAPFDPAYDRLVHQAPTRSRESRQILDCLRAGRSVLVICLNGDGALDFARSLANSLGQPELSLLRVSTHSSTDEVRRFADPTRLDGGPRIMCGAHLLSAETEPVIDRALQSSSVPIAYLVDGDRLRTVHRDGGGPLRQIAAAWSSGELERIDLARLTGSESLALVTGLSTTLSLNDLQLRSLAALSDGRPLIAADLVAWAETSPSKVPQRYPHASVDAPSFGHRSLSRLATQYPLLRQDTLDAARRLGALGPMPVRTARQLFGDTTVSRLIDLRLAREFEVTGRPSVAVSPLHIAAMDSAHVSTANVDEEGHLHRRLETMWRAGYPVGEVAEIRLARDVINENLDLNRTRVQLLLRAARSLNRLGDPMEATVMLLTIDDEVNAEPGLLLEWQLQSITADLVNGDRGGTVELIRSAVDRGLVGTESEPVSVEFVFVAGAALASEIALPQWWTDFLRDVVDEWIPGTANLVSSFTGSVMTCFGDVEAVLANAATPPALRFAALAALCQHHLKIDDPEGLAAAATTGFDLIAELTAVGAWQLDDFTVTMIWYFAIGATVNRLLAGVEPERSELTSRTLLEIACGTSDHSGWQFTATAAWCTGILRLIEGEVEAAARDYDAFAAAVTPALLAVGWGLRDTVGRWQRSNAPFYRLPPARGDEPTEDYRLDDGLTSFLLGPGSPSTKELPMWMRTIFTHARVLDGTVSPSTADASLREDPEICLPGPRAARRHVAAAAAEDAEALLSVGHELRQVGYRGAADHAYSRARALFLGRRLSSRAREAGKALEDLRLRSSVSPEDPRPRSQPSATADTALAVTLTDRELEICRLIAEGLTNVQISQRLVLSVRTVESHVLQARAKLGAARRRDIPMIMLRLRDAGRLNAPQSNAPRLSAEVRGKA